jgi:hypothetical protein
MGKEFDENVDMVKTYVSNIRKNYEEQRDDIKESTEDSMKKAKNIRL